MLQRERLLVAFASLSLYCLASHDDGGDDETVVDADVDACVVVVVVVAVGLDV